jgi:ribosomal protein S18 acetylase RimI-like enzyme
MDVPEIRSEPWTLVLANELEDRRYAFNAATTGIADGEGLALTVRNASGRAVAAAVGHTWGGTCEIKTVWLDEPLRRSGLGRTLVLRAARPAQPQYLSSTLA